jgi:predicted AAA+ superfamily ATPase
MIKRSHLEVLSKRITEKRKFIQVVFGPRQVGKTTVVESSVGTHLINTSLTEKFRLWY